MLALVECKLSTLIIETGASNLDLFDNSELRGGAWLGWEGFLNGNTKPLVPLIVSFDINSHIRLNKGDMEHGPL